MLELKNICKIYETHGFKQNALEKVSISFRENEFVSILGPSGSGKTTLLNIIGGLDNYTSGDLIINGVSTKKYKDRDWDTYRNHKVGFVFQNYNLIPHQNILSNVELALTLSGVSKKERVKRAKEALKKVGLEEHINKKPNQLSGGQMQRVAIARALVNNPDILLADEPTGALDSKTSKQIMELLKEVAKDKLVVMVTHNKELADEYSTRIIELRDGVIKGDNNPFDEEKEETKKDTKKDKKTNMSFFTALSLSLNNLMTKKGRTILTAFAGSIGIIGIALILSLSSGVQEYINRVQEETLTSYPLTIESASIDLGSAITEVELKKEDLDSQEENRIYSNNTIGDTMQLMSSRVQTNNLDLFKKHIESSDSAIKDYTTAISYEYNLHLQLFKENTEDGIVQVNPNTVLDSIGMKPNEMQANFIVSDVWSKMFENEELNNQMYKLLAGKMPENYNEVVIVVDENNRISDFVLYALGLKDQNELKDMYDRITKGEEVESKETSYSFDDILNLKFKLLLNTDYYEKVNNIWVNKKEDKDYLKNKIQNAEEIKVVGILKPNDDATVTTSMMGGVLYNKELEEYVIDKINNSEIVKEQKESPDTNVLTGLEFSDEEFDISKLNDQQRMYLQTLPAEQLADLISQYKEQAEATYESVLQELGSVDLEKPTSIYLYAKDFESKETIKNLISDYNENAYEFSYWNSRYDKLCFNWICINFTSSI